MRLSLNIWLFLFIMAGCGTSDQINSEVTQVRRYHTVINFDNESNSEPEADLEIHYDDSTVFSGIVHYNGVADYWNSESIVSPNSGPHHVSIEDKFSGTRLDTLITNTDTLTPVFFTYTYHVLTAKGKKRFKKTAFDAEEEKIMRSMFAEPKHFSVLVISGQISIP